MPAGSMQSGMCWAGLRRAPSWRCASVSARSSAVCCARMRRCCSARSTCTAIPRHRSVVWLFTCQSRRPSADPDQVALFARWHLPGMFSEEKSMRIYLKCLSVLASSFSLGACQTLHEAPALNAEVVAGKLAPLRQRLPEKPEVISPNETGGRYGGILHTALLANGDDNGVLRFIAQGLTRWDPGFDQVLPNIAERWTVNESATEYVFHLRRGMRWSDGQPFTADDIVFAVNDVIADPTLFGAPPDRYQAGGRVMQAEKIDDWQVRIRFAAGNRQFPEELAGPYGHHLVIYPRHYCAQFHPRHNPAVAGNKARETFESKCPAYGERWMQLGKPTLDPWVVVEPYGDGRPRVLVQRNPFFWPVDTAGRQLSYLDAIEFRLFRNADEIVRTLAEGQLDLQIRHVAGLSARDARQQLLARGTHVLLEMPDVNASAVGLYLNHTTPDEAVRKLYGDVRFKAALSLAMDRAAIAREVFQGEVQPWQVGPPVGHRFYDARLATQYIGHEPARAAQILDALGLARDAQGYRLLPDGRRLSLRAIVNRQSAQMVSTLALIQVAWKQIGVDLVIEAADRSVVAQRAWSNDYEIGVDVVSGGIDPTQNPRAYLAQHPADSRQGLPWVLWYNSGGKRGMKPSPGMIQRQQLWDQWKATTSQDEADVLFRRILALAADGLEVLGTVTSPAQQGVRSLRLHGVPASMPGAWIWPTPNPSLPQQYFFAD
ncbi:MAG: hypothetical protein CGU28_15555 [Candidatus Dactylopiibacterium carminicum]|nr:MAG: hypothetical protein CGU28_15555 [Candidatus Dactylopiibacterium carminicum]